jgi:hypothetical protein
MNVQAPKVRRHCVAAPLFGCAPAPMAAYGKWHCSVDDLNERQLWAVISGSVLPVSRKPTLAAMQKNSKLGSEQPFAAAAHEINAK